MIKTPNIPTTWREVSDELDSFDQQAAAQFEQAQHAEKAAERALAKGDLSEHAQYTAQVEYHANKASAARQEKGIAHSTWMTATLPVQSPMVKRRVRKI